MRTDVDRRALVLLSMLAAAGLALLAHRAFVSPQSRLLLQDPEAPWVLPEAPVDARIRQWGRLSVPETTFVRSFELREPLPTVARLRFRSRGSVEVCLNGTRVQASGEGSDWRRYRHAEVARLLRPGRNELVARVRDAHGPPLLSLRLEAPGWSVATGPEWRVRLDGGAEARAMIADDVRGLEGEDAGEVPLRELRRKKGKLALIALLGIALAASLPRLGGRIPSSWDAPVLFACLAVAWVHVFRTKLLHLSLATGFDARHHLQYVGILLGQHRLPRPAEGWSTYHPPLFYAIAAALAGPAGWLGGLSLRTAALKLVPFAAGFANVALAHRLARRFWPTDRAAPLLAALFVAVLPLNLTMAAYFSNEGLHAALSAGAALVATELLLEAEPGARRLATFSVLLGLALLTKLSALVTIGVLVPAVLARLALASAAGHGRRALRGIALVAPGLAVCGWFYARNLWLYGAPWFVNWKLPGPGHVWWSPPGFHTLAYYTGFGAALVRPYFSAFHSFWDALYSTLWGDGLLAGRAAIAARHPWWRYDWMAAGYLLALPLTGLLLVGFAGLLRDALGHPAPRQRAAFLLQVVWLGVWPFAILYSTLTLPYVGQARASYALSLAPALGLCLSRGARAVLTGLRRVGFARAEMLLGALVSLAFATFYLSFAG